MSMCVMAPPIYRYYKNLNEAGRRRKKITDSNIFETLKSVHEDLTDGKIRE